ncbi:DUF5605 domain-containing protein [Schaalia vaccimaxillae]|uniref:DUF5605 domain-containing protein n=1 Tax=Schaalia vaccimaxillae TaxID=183916 RepID=UPI0003B394D0|nr:DUF5605 domain-containing protein [Schaalia vaccimaxillae]
MSAMTARTPVSTILATKGAGELLIAVCPIAGSEELNPELLKFPVGVFLALHLGPDSTISSDLLGKLEQFEDTTPRWTSNPTLPPSPSYEDEATPIGSATAEVHRLDGNPGPLRMREGIELVLRGPSHGNPFVDVEALAIFTRRDAEDEALTVGAVYDGMDEDGAGRYLVRFLPPEAGTWSWEIASNARSLDSLAGVFEVEESESPGVVRVAGMGFVHADGTPFTAFGTTAYAWIAQPKAVQDQTLRTLAASPFNKLRMCLTPKHYSYNSNEPERLPFERTERGWDPERFDLAFWRNLDERVMQLGQLGIQADIIFFHSYDRWGFATMPGEVDERYLRYAVRRLAAQPNVWWSMANEYELLVNKQNDDWHRLAELVVAEDHAAHLLGIHNIFKVFDPEARWLTHVSVQGGGSSMGDVVASLRRRWAKPVTIDEFGYEGDLEFGWGNLTPYEVVRRFWLGTLAGGHLTHGETYHRDDQLLWWSKGGELHGESPERITLLRRLVEESPTGAVSPLFRGIDVTAAGVEGEYILEYFGERQPRRRSVELPRGLWAIEVIDTWNMTISPVGDDGSCSEQAGTHRHRVVVHLPSRPWMALRARRLAD